MMVKANIGMAFRSLISSKQRSFLALLGIVIGIGAVIALVSIGIIFKANSLKSFLELGTDYIVVRKGWGGGGFGFGGGDKGPQIDFQQAMELSQYLDSVVDSSPVGQTGSSMTFHGKDVSASILAVIDNFLPINRFKLDKGRFLSPLDQNMNFMIIGKEVADDLKEKGAMDVIGEHIRINDKLFTIIGMLGDAPRGSMRPFYANQSVLIPYSTYSRVFDKPEVAYILVRMNKEYPPQQVTEDIKNYFHLRDPALNLEVNTAEEIIKQMESQMQMITIFLGAIGGISLIVGGVGVMNVMLVSVTERKKEIGIRRALGALQRDIQLQFIIEALVLCIVGGLIGIGMGVGASYVFSITNGWDFLVSPPAIWLGLGVSTAIGLFFGYYPARQASKLDPLQALRSE